MNLNEKKRDVAREICRKYNVTLGVDALRAFADVLQPVKLLRGRNVVEEGQVCECMYYVEKGLVLQHYKKNGSSVTEHISCEGDIVVCIESFFQVEPSRIVVTMLEPGILYAIPREAMRELARQSFEICNMIFRIYAHSLIVSQRKADVLRFETAKERYLRTLQETPEIIRRAPLHYVASFLQMTPETLSRVRSQVTDEMQKLAESKDKEEGKKESDAM